MNSDRRLRGDPRPGLAVTLVWAAVAAFVTFIAWSYIRQGGFPGPDDILRLIQVRDLIGGQGWFDLHQYRINPPGGVEMHWSRLVDIPLFLSILLLEPLLGMDQAERVTALILPLLILLAILQVIGRLAWRLFDRQTAILSCIVLALWPSFIIQMQPLRIDHHSWQILAVAVALWAISWRQPSRGGSIAGMAMGAGTIVSLEVLPMVAGFAIVLALRWLLDYRSRWWLTSYMQALALTIAILFALTRGFSGAGEYCDTITPPHIGFFIIAALGTEAIAALPKLPLVTWAALFTAVAGLAAGFVALAGPQCLTAPFGTLDPLVREYWYVNVQEGMPIWKIAGDLALPMAIQILVSLACSVALCLRHRDWLRQWWIEYTLLVLVAAVGAALTYRSLYFSAVLGAIPIAWCAGRAFNHFRSAPKLSGKVGAAAAFYALLFPWALAAFVVGLFSPAAEPSRDGLKVVNFRETTCELSSSAKAMAGLATGTIFTTLDVGPYLLLNSDHSVVATGHHRANLAMRDVISGFISEPAQARTVIAKHEADYVVICSDIRENQNFSGGRLKNSLMSHLLADDPPEWLEKVDLDTPGTFKVWRVRRD